VRDYSQAQWLKPVILDTQEVKTRRIVVPGQPKQKVHEAYFK
jgi:hypothetical protein